MSDADNAPIPKDILAALAASDLPTSQFKVVMVILLATYGKGKETASMFSDGICEVTKMTNSLVSRALSDLRKRRILLVRDSAAPRRPGIYRINPNLDQWLSKEDKLPEIVRPQPTELVPLDSSVADNGTPFKKGDHKILIENWYDVFYQATQQHYPFRGGRDGKTIKDILQIYGLEMSQKLMLTFYNEWLEGDQFLQDAGLNIGIWRARIPRMLSNAALQNIETSQMKARLERFADARKRARSGI